MFKVKSSHILSSVAVALFACAISAVSAAPKISFDKESLDFGTALCGPLINFTFNITNTGDEELDITNAIPNCGCTHVEMKVKKIAPGKSSVMEATFSTIDFLGPISKTITVFSNDPERKEVILTLTGNVVVVATFKPEKVNFGTLKVNASATHLLRVIPYDPKTFVIKKVTCPGTRVTVPSFKKYEDKTGTYWEVQVVITADNNPGHVFESVEFETNADKAAIVSARVYGDIVE